MTGSVDGLFCLFDRNGGFTNSVSIVNGETVDFFATHRFRGLEPIRLDSVLGGREGDSERVNAPESTPETAPK